MCKVCRAARGVGEVMRKPILGKYFPAAYTFRPAFRGLRIRPFRPPHVSRYTPLYRMSSLAASNSPQPFAVGCEQAVLGLAADSQSFPACGKNSLAFLWVLWHRRIARCNNATMFLQDGNPSRRWTVVIFVYIAYNKSTLYLEKGVHLPPCLFRSYMILAS